RLLAATPHIFERLTEKQLRLLPDLAAQGNLAAVKVMVELGWPIAARGGGWDASALNLAVFAGDAELVAYLLDHGASGQERHGYGNNVVGTLSFASTNTPAGTEAHGQWRACAKLLVAHGMPVPPPNYVFSEEVSAYFDAVEVD